MSSAFIKIKNKKKMSSSINAKNINKEVDF